MLIEQYTNILKRVQVVGQTGPGEADVAGVVRRVAEVKRMIVGKAAIELKIEQAALPRRINIWNPGERLRKSSVFRYDAYPPGPFSDDQLSVGKKGQRPWVDQTRCEGLHFKWTSRRREAGVVAARCRDNQQ